MERSTLIAIALAPIVGPIIYWILSRPGWLIHTLLTRYMRDGRLRRFLFWKVD